MIDLTLQVLLSFVPVCAFLASLLYIDSYKLITLSRVVRLIAAGALAAVISYFVNQKILTAAAINPADVVRFAAPGVEETMKMIPVAIVLMRRRIGFVIDAAICGFAAGTGFALIENLYYMTAVPDGGTGFWLARGFGTAIMHGGATAIAAMITKALAQRRGRENLMLVIPGILTAFTVHALFNQFIVSPLASAVAMIVVLPPLITFVFAQSERAVQRWMGSGFDVDSDLLEAIRSEDFASSRAGRYLHSLREHFQGPILADMLCYLRIHAELSLRAKGILMMRETGFPVAKDSRTAAKVVELRYLESTIGRTGLLALAPLLHRSSHDAWQLQLLEE